MSWSFTDEQEARSDAARQRGCRHCDGSGWRPATYSSGPSPCGCDEPQEEDEDA